MSISQQIKIRSSVLKGHVNKYAIVGLGISMASIFIASILASYQQTGFIDLPGFILAQKTNPALWALDFTPLIFVYWGQAFCYELVSTMESMLDDRTRELVNKSSDLELKLHYETNHDHLTNLPNQRLLSQRLNQGIQHIHKGEQLVVILLHINSFKEINYKYGSFNANNVLIQFAEKLKTILLEPYLLQAYMGMNMVARLQGAEFAILIPRLIKDHHLDDVLVKLLAATSASFMIDGNNVSITTAAGIAIYPLHGSDDISLLRHASSGLFHAEQEGLSYVIYDASMDNDMRLDHLKIKELSDAIDNEKIDVWYQPDLALKTEKIIGVEAMIYFEDVNDGVMTIDKLLPLLEGSGLVNKLSYLTLTKAIKQLAVWHQANYKVYSTVTLFDATDMAIPAMIEGLLKENDISPEFLKIQLTEKTCLSDQARSMIVLKQLANLGIKIVISDFCSGYSSFTYLTNFPISEIKIDKSFVMSMMSDEKKLNIVHAIINLAGIMNLMVYADGIEDKAILKKLKQLGCLYGQGPYFSSAVDEEGMTALLAKP